MANTDSHNGVATRSMLQATYTPRKVESGRDPSIHTRGVEKASLVARFYPTTEELSALRSRYTESATSRSVDAAPANTKSLRAIDTIASAIDPEGHLDPQHRARAFAQLDVDSLVQVLADLIALRRETVTGLRTAHDTIRAHAATPGADSAARGMSASPDTGENVHTLMEYAIANDVEAESARRTLALARSFALNPAAIAPAEFAAAVARAGDAQLRAVRAAGDALKIEPVGYLHLERMSFTPVGTERGELVYSVPLAPGEEVNLTHREWSRTSEEFERIVTDYLEEFSEEGVTEKSELAESVNSQTQHTSAFNTSVTASGGYGPVNITASVGYNTSDSASRSEQLSRNKSSELTQKASSRVKKEHKISFKVASAMETEDMAVRRIKNPSLTSAVRVDYYQFMRKWKVDLYRYGVRLTYDLVLPEPGLELSRILREIQVLREVLEGGIEKKIELNGITHWPGFQFTRDNIKFKGEQFSNVDVDYHDILALFNGQISDPEPELEWTYAIPNPFQRQYPHDREHYDDLYSFEVPTDYVITKAGLKIDSQEQYKAPTSWNIYVRDLSGGFALLHRKSDREFAGDDMSLANYDGWNGMSGKISLFIHSYAFFRITIGINLHLKLRDNVKEAYRDKVWNIIREAAEQQFVLKRRSLESWLARLEEYLGQEDTLSLRKKEREEVMKGVLRFLDIPNFRFFPAALSGKVQPGESLEPVLYDQSTQLVRPDVDVLGLCHTQGKTIKFLQHAIEWENMLYFLYPYFWTDPSQWEFKKYLDHPDPLHRAFLKAGSARVVLTIRPGYEAAFIAFMGSGDLNALPPYPYMTIAQEFENYAQTNYPGIPPANPVNNFRALLHPLQRRAWADMQRIMVALEDYVRFPFPQQYQAWKAMQGFREALEHYQGDNGAYPDDLHTALDATETPKDPWGNAYVYSKDDTNPVGYTLLSYGADGAAGGDGENEDIDCQPQPSCRAYPAGLAELNDFLAACGAEPLALNDPWGNPYAYTYPGIYNEYDLISYGADGAPGGDGENADITNYAEASLIGQWYEYTPTSAMDIDYLVLRKPAPQNGTNGHVPENGHTPENGEPAVVTYVVKEGDYLRSIAEHFYGDEMRWKAIYLANLDVIGENPDLIHPGQKLVIPQ